MAASLPRERSFPARPWVNPKTGEDEPQKAWEDLGKGLGSCGGESAGIWLMAER